MILDIVHYILKYIKVNGNLTDRLDKINHFYYILIVSFILMCGFVGYNVIVIQDKPPSLLISILAGIISFGVLNASSNLKGKYLIIMEYPSRWKSKGTIKLGRIFFRDKKKHSFHLNMEDLAQHMFITGITGTGKSNFMQSFLLEFSKKHGNIPFLLTEFKGEYHHLQTKIKDMLILKPGENFSINIFDPEGSNPEIHAERVYKIFESGGLLENVDYSPQMERVFVDILNTVIKTPKHRSWFAFKKVSEMYLADATDITFKKSVIAVQNRIRRYYVGTLKNLFDIDSGIHVKDLFQHKVLLDLHSIIKLGGEKEDALFFLNMVLKYLWDRNIELGSKDYEGIRHITIIEDAQYFAPQELSSRTKLTSYIEDIALLLRGTGECLITLATRPNISKEILNNAGILACFQIHMQKDLMQELLNLQEWQVKYLSELKRGQCIIRVNSIEKPFALKCDFIKRHWLTDEEIMRNNQRVLDNKLNRLETKIERIIEEVKVKNPDIIKEMEKKKEPNDLSQTEEIAPDDKAYCKFCGDEIEGDAEYCEGCETELTEEDKEFKALKDLIEDLSEKESRQKK
ncbi:hypothetical protein ES703_42665 [subsurface metagenome]